ncbi:MAG: peptide chain release factor N(5)-glutamine methyltransferase [Acidobacteriota bacterium]|nr:peptide chain release factor N(5)-glutamine methyltransferase [Acidobacteriota bacterium]
MTIGDALRRATDLARQGGSEATAWDARILLAHALGHANPLALPPDAPLSEALTVRFEEMWTRRLSGVPVQHLVGEWDFFGRPFRVDSRGLIPRPETEVLVLQSIGAAPGARRILDLGTGSGIVAITLLKELPSARALAVDASVQALALARHNASRLGVLSRLWLAGSDWLTAIEAPPFDLVVSNPPYLARSEARGLSRTVAEHDPELALYGGDDGLESIRQLLDAVPRVLPPGAPYLFEIGFGQARDIEQEVRNRPAWRFDGIAEDMAGIPRVVRLVRK